jgi:two-component system cell cycle sensor histidine kinase/response regulator CckA
VEVDSAQIEQSLLNLYINAAEAMPNGGDLYLETENILLEKNTLVYLLSDQAICL